MNLSALSVSELQNLLKKKEIKAEEVVRSFLKRIEEQDEKLSAFITVLTESAVKRARMIDRKKEKGKLAGGT